MIVCPDSSTCHCRRRARLANFDPCLMAEERYLGLDKRHGFFRAIERNQLSRDSYHREEEERKEVRA